ncbi:hypothetical protein M0813_27139 [Anaeramoeba flamelloides]|uniref:PSP1 C-terminal domain-containing protein n=1 Tax=Anaeramoeba flamelloides TaxID=1746091 RepID=A0ABQ8XYA1_9EUKA|nr:hypothetical protein M0813_27139 [Anaeramoeba flamelloides]
MNLPKNAPIYNLTVPLPFIKEIYKLSKMKYLYKHKIKVIFHQIIGDSVEQQTAAGKLSSGGIEMCRSCSLNKKDIFFNLGKSLHLEDTTSKLNSNSKQEDSNPNPNINSDSNKPFNFNSNPDQNLNPEIENLNSNFFDFEVKTNLRDPKQIKQIQKEYSSKKKYLLVQKIKADPNEIKFTFDNPRKFYLISPDEFRNIINLIPNTWNKYLISKSESEKEIVLKGTDQMEIEKDQEQGTTQINQIEQVSGEITIEKEDTNETIGSNNIIGVDDQKDPKKFEILVKYNTAFSNFCERSHIIHNFIEK